MDYDHHDYIDTEVYKLRLKRAWERDSSETGGPTRSRSSQFWDWRLIHE